MGNTWKIKIDDKNIEDSVEKIGKIITVNSGNFNNTIINITNKFLIFGGIIFCFHNGKYILDHIVSCKTYIKNEDKTCKFGVFF